jgi:bifunctional hydroxylase/dehydrase
MVATDVVVVGAGPVGLMLAGEIRLGGANVVVLEKLPEPSGESRGLGFTARTAELLAQRGVLDRLDDPQAEPHGHFGGIPMDYGVVEGSHFGVRNVPQHRLEAALAAWVGELGVEVRRGHLVTDLRQDPDGVRVTVEHDGRRREPRCRYLVGADGGRGTVRGLAGFEFAGTDATCEMFLADVADLPERIRPRPIGERVPGGMVMAGPVGEDVDRIIVCERGAPPRHRPTPPEFAEVAAAWNRLTGDDISAGTARWVSSFSDATRQVTSYRLGRVLLAGDAAHVHLPAGGQGLSVGIQDAVNLGWKLAAQVRGWAPEHLLDSYHEERHPVGERLLLNTRAQNLLFLSGAEVEPLRGVVAELMELDSVRRHLAGMVSGFDVRYPVGLGEHPLLGMRIPDCRIVTEVGPASTGGLLRRARGLLLMLGHDPCGGSTHGSIDTASQPGRDAGRRAAGWSDRVDVVRAAPDPEGPLRGLEAVLIRPDGYVAWTSPGAGPLAPALRRWFGPERAEYPARPDRSRDTAGHHRTPSRTVS